MAGRAQLVGAVIRAACQARAPRRTVTAVAAAVAAVLDTGGHQRATGLSAGSGGSAEGGPLKRQRRRERAIGQQPERTWQRRNRCFC